MKIVNPIGRIIEDEAADYAIPYACFGSTAAYCSACGCGCNGNGTASTNVSSGVSTNAKSL